MQCKASKAAPAFEKATSTAKAKKHCIDVPWSLEAVIPVNNRDQVMSASRIPPHGHMLKTNRVKRKKKMGMGIMIW